MFKKKTNGALCGIVFFLHEKGRISRHLNFFSHRKSDWIGAHFPTKKKKPRVYRVHAVRTIIQLFCMTDRLPDIHVAILSLTRKASSSMPFRAHR